MAVLARTVVRGRGARGAVAVGAILGLMVGITAPAEAHGGRTWVPQPGLSVPQGGLATASALGRIFVFGGFTDGFAEALDTVQVYNPASHRWRTGTPMPTARGDAAAATVRHRIYVIGGYGPGPALDTVEVFHPRTGRWTSAASLPAPRAGAAAVAVGRRIFVMGGYDAEDDAVSSVEVYDTRSGHWSQGAPMPTARGNLRAVRLGRRIYAVGGADTEGVPMATAEAYRPARGTWTAVASMLLPREGQGLTTGRDGRLYAIAGVDAPGHVTSTSETYDPAANAWWPLPARFPRPRARGGMVAATSRAGRILAIGGFLLDPDRGVVSTDQVDALRVGGCRHGATVPVGQAKQGRHESGAGW